MNRTLLFASFSTAACLVANAHAQAGTVFFDFLLDGQQEVPANDSTSFGFATLTYESTTQTFDIELFTDGIALDDLLGVGPNNSPIHIHSAPAGSNGGIVIDLGTLSSFVDEGGGLLSFNATSVPIGANEAALFAGGLYLNIHTSAFPGGEIRGQIVPGPAGALLAAPIGALALRRRRAV